MEKTEKEERDDVAFVNSVNKRVAVLTTKNYQLEQSIDTVIEEITRFETFIKGLEMARDVLERKLLTKEQILEEAKRIEEKRAESNSRVFGDLYKEAEIDKNFLHGCHLHQNKEKPD